MIPVIACKRTESHLGHEHKVFDGMHTHAAWCDGVKPEIQCFEQDPHPAHRWGFYQNRDGLQCNGVSET